MTFQRHIIPIFITLIMCGFSPFIPSAHGAPETLQSKITAIYDTTAEEIMEKEWSNKLPRHLDFMALRRQYVTTPYYDPFSEDLLKLIDDIAAEMLEAFESGEDEKVKRLHKFYKDIMTYQIANFTIVSRAWQLAREHPIYGNYKFWNTVRSELFQTILESGDGFTFETAYDVITLDEETYLLQYLGYDVKSTLPSYERGQYRYNIHAVVEESTGLDYEIYINTTVPVRYLESQERKERLGRN